MSNIQRDDDIVEQIDDASFIIDDADHAPTEDLQGASGSVYSVFMKGSDLQFIIDEKIVHTASLRSMPKFDYKNPLSWSEVCAAFKSGGFKKAVKAFK